MGFAYEVLGLARSKFAATLGFTLAISDYGNEKFD